MKMPMHNHRSLFCAVSQGSSPSTSFVFGAEATASWSDLLTGSALDSRGDELQGRSVVLATRDQLTCLWALMELDGVAARIVLYPPDLSMEHLPYVTKAAEADVLVTDRIAAGQVFPGVRMFLPCCRNIGRLTYSRSAPIETEWILLTSGTTGPPKLVVHTLSSLAGAIASATPARDGVVWSTFYDFRRYGGLQILLRAALTGSSLVLSSATESSGDFLGRASRHGVTHISGTPSHWRNALMNPRAKTLQPEYVRLSGEIADQGILNRLKSAYPGAQIAHAFASTEAGVAFDVNDGHAGFPMAAIDNTPGVEMKVEHGSLRIRSSRTASRYLGDPSLVLKDEDGFVDTRDLLEVRDGRCYFAGRVDGVINVGGMKVHPEEVEEVINRHPRVQISLVRGKKNPITGSLVIADVVTHAVSVESDDGVHLLQAEIMVLCRQALSPHKVPSTIHVVPSLAVGESGKLVRHHA
jgi:acyl-coenzyme A synthetase/AMP-(fatty) acid ligase